jgi:hypothetical protein
MSDPNGGQESRKMLPRTDYIVFQIAPLIQQEFSTDGEMQLLTFRFTSAMSFENNLGCFHPECLGN